MSLPINQIICGDNVETLRTLPDACVDSCVTDPPYGIEFMGKQWDRGVPGVELWREVLRVLKPGGHLLAFAGTRTQHRMATAIEDAGFEIRDMIAWVYGSGFPKSLDVSKAIDAKVCYGKSNSTALSQSEKSRPVIGTVSRVVSTGRTADQGETAHGVKANMERWHNYAHADIPVTAAATPEAKQWAGWGTALKPALEPITVARKPLCGTVAANVLQHGTGGLNVDGCRVGSEVIKSHHTAMLAHGGQNTRPWHDGHESTTHEHNGRWPANLIHDGSDEVVGLFPDAGGGFGVRGGRPTAVVGDYGMKGTMEEVGYGDSGSASRFFYCAKADASERRNSKHPTIKPVSLMRYLVRLVTPPGGLVLDPFGGSGTTAEAARLEHCRFLLMELSPEYCADAAERLRQGVLF